MQQRKEHGFPGNDCIIMQRLRDPQGSFSQKAEAITTIPLWGRQLISRTVTRTEVVRERSAPSRDNRTVIDDGGGSGIVRQLVWLPSRKVRSRASGSLRKSLQVGVS